MNTLVWILSIAYFFAGSEISNAQFSADADKFFKSYVTEKGINYSAIKKNEAVLAPLLKAIETHDLSSATVQSKAAFYINSYNLLVIKSVIDNYPISSPLKVDGFFDKTKHNIAGESLTLNDIENIKLRDEFGDNRIHFALVCAGKGCPAITNQAFYANTLDKRLQELTVKALTDDSFIRVNNGDKKVDISQIFEWFQGDFGANESQVITYINKFRTTPIPASYKVGYYEYNWELNGF